VIEFTDNGALFDQMRRYRYTLWRAWTPNTAKRFVNFVMLNPSTADEDVLDPTVTRCMNFAQRWGYDGAYVTNIFALRSTDPRELYSCRNPVGPANDTYIEQTAKMCDLVVAAWGVHGKYQGRGLAVAEALQPFDPQCFALTKEGFPRHPLYLRNDSELMPFRLSVAKEMSRG
jgi:hypothetical protein